ncbi:hypothetical protein [Nocardia crassostreae]|uniref:hypothetical protein n=1 Tax=Nocardia crassostreae TaxID=53428 RepID=UPI0014724B20|nr:hypothetical protein [Nocardia crassostreae]
MRTLIGVCDSTTEVDPFAFVYVTDFSVRSVSFEVFGSKPACTPDAGTFKPASGAKSATGCAGSSLLSGFSLLTGVSTGTLLGLGDFGAAAAWGASTM